MFQTEPERFQIRQLYALHVIHVDTTQVHVKGGREKHCNTCKKTIFYLGFL